MAFLIVAGVLLIVNAIFLLGSLIYTVKSTSGKVDPLSVPTCQLDQRMSLQPQMVLYQAIVRVSGNPVPGFENLEHPPITEKSENQTKEATS